jgi:hypothetical protein
VLLTADVVLHGAAQIISPSGQSEYRARAAVADVASVDVITNCNRTADAVGREMKLDMERVPADIVWVMGRGPCCPRQFVSRGASP